MTANHTSYLFQNPYHFSLFFQHLLLNNFISSPRLQLAKSCKNNLIIQILKHISKMSQECEMQECNNDENFQEQNYEYEDDYQYEVDNLVLENGLSKDRPYSIYHLDQLLKKIWEEITMKSMLCAMSDGWTLMLYYFTNFNSNYFDDLLDQEQTGRNVIKYKENYQVTQSFGECGVCLGETELYNNACGHRFCRDCWSYHVSLNHTDRSIYELFPLCQEEGCYEKTNFHLMEVLWQDNPKVKSNFESLLCLKYAQKSIHVKICPNQACGKAIYLNTVIESTVICECDTQVCRHCGLRGHWPLQCVDISNWNSMVMDKDNQWINKLVTQKCPMCKETIQKNNGCIHMTCLCKYQFCWICLKIWKGHKSFYECASITRDDHEKKLREEQQKMSKDEKYYNLRFEQAKGEVERLSLSIKRISRADLSEIKKQLEEVQVLSIHADILDEMREFVKEAWKIVQRCSIYTFFQREEFQDLKRLIYRLDKGANEVDDFFSDTLVKLFRQFKKSIEERFQQGQSISKEVFCNEGKKIKEYFMEAKDKFIMKMREGQRVIEQIKKGEISLALENVLKPHSALFIDKEPIFATDKQPIEPQSVEIPSESYE